MRKMLGPVVVLVIVAAVFSAYWGVRDNDFIGIDDSFYLTNNAHVQAGLTLEGVGWAFTATEVANWHPLTWLSHMLDWQMFGDNPGAHHLMSVAIHALNAVLVLLALRMLSGVFWPAACVALLWAVHPLHVESVAWASERKDLLSALFGLLCLIAYAWYVRQPNVPRYLLVFLTLALGLLAKPMLVTWPCLLLLLDVWPLQRLTLPRLARQTAPDKGFRHHTEHGQIPALPLRRVIVEKIPLLLLVLGSSVITIIAQGRGKAIIPVERIGIVQRLANSVVAYVQYLADTFWPTGLAIFYPHPHHWPIAIVLGSAALLITLTVMCVLLWRRAPWLMIGWLWFLGTLLPVIGLLQVGAQAWADRYSYLPQIGLLLATMCTIWRLLGTRPLWVVAIVLAATAALVMATQRQAEYWRNSRTLFTHTLAVTSENWYMHHALAVLAQRRGDAPDQERHLIELARILPRNVTAITLLADFYTGRNQLDKGIPLLERALEIDPNLAETLNNLAWWLATASDVRLRDAQRAVGLAERACAATDSNSPLYPGFLDTLSAAQAAVGRFDEAAVTAAKALDIAIAQKQDDLAKQIGVHIRRYHAGLPAQ